MARRRFLGAIDYVIQHQVENEKKFSADTLSKIDTVGALNTDTVNNINSLPFVGSKLIPNTINITGDGNNLLLQGTNSDGSTVSFRILVEGGLLKLVEQ